MDKEKAIEFLKKAWSVTLKVIQTILFVFAIILIFYPISELILWVLANVFPLIWSDTFHFGWIDSFVNHWLPYIYHPKCNWFCFMMFNVVCLSISGFCAEYNNFSLCGIFGIILVYFNFNPHLFETWIGWITALGVIICLGLGASGSSSENSSSPSYSNNSGCNNSSSSNTSCGSGRPSWLSEPTDYSTKATTVSQKQISYYKVFGKDHICVYDENGHQLFQKRGVVLAQSSSSITIKDGQRTFVYDANGHMKTYF